jgi:CHAD domain-containing protein
VARINPGPTLSRFDDALAQARRGEAEGVHDLRVLSRRLLVWLELAEVRVLRDDLKWLLRETSALRDLDVFDALLTREGRAVLRPPAVARAQTALRSKRVLGLTTAFRALGTIRRRRASRLLQPLERALVKARFKKNEEGVHSLRKLVRRVRYAREWVEVSAGELSHVQNVLGVVCDVLALFRLRRSVSKPAR